MRPRDLKAALKAHFRPIFGRDIERETQAFRDLAVKMRREADEGDPTMKATDALGVTGR